MHSTCDCVRPPLGTLTVRPPSAWTVQVYRRNHQLTCEESGRTQRYNSSVYFTALIRMLISPPFSLHSIFVAHNTSHPPPTHHHTPHMHPSPCPLSYIHTVTPSLEQPTRHTWPWPNSCPLFSDSGTSSWTNTPALW